MYNPYSFKKIKELQEEFGRITKQFDLTDWRTVRTEYYWEADTMPPGQALEHKIELVDYYNRYGVPKQ